MKQGGNPAAGPRKAADWSWRKNSGVLPFFEEWKRGSWAKARPALDERRPELGLSEKDSQKNAAFDHQLLAE